jgi:tRNA wybutosine-synthesizing protein 4
MGGTELYSKDYCLLSGDLREFTESIVPKLKAQGFDTRYTLMDSRQYL